MLDIQYDPPDGIAQALVEGNVDELTRIIEESVAKDHFHILASVYGEGVRSFLTDPTVLVVATEYGHSECVQKILLELGRKFYSSGHDPEEDYNDYDYGEENDEPDAVAASASNATIPVDYFSALILAFSKGLTEISQTLIEFRLFESPGIQLCYARFIAAVKCGDFVELENLLDKIDEKEKNVFLKGWKGHNIMNMCLLYGCPLSCLQKCIDLGIDVNGWDYNGLTPLMCAVIGRNLACVQFLLDKGAKPYAPHLLLCRLFLADGTISYGQGTETSSPFSYRESCHGPSALLYAASMGNIPILELMAKAAPRDMVIPGRIKEFKTDGPLMFAVAFDGGMEMVKRLLQYEATKENFNTRPVDLAIQRNDMELFDLLLQQFPASTWDETDIDDILYTCVSTQSRPQFLAKLCESVGERFFEIDGGKSMFHLIDYSVNGLMEKIKVYFGLPGFSINTRYCVPWHNVIHGSTCFMYACDVKNLKCAELFLKMGAHVDMDDDLGKTPALRAVEREDAECLQFLVDAGADLDIMDNRDATVFSVALAGDGSCLEVLLKSKKLLVKEQNGDGPIPKPKLKRVHRKSMEVFSMHAYRCSIGSVSFKAALILIKYELFCWHWLSGVDVKSMRSLLFGALVSGFSPVQISCTKWYSFSPLMAAFISRDEALLRYLLANLYFLPNDYQQSLKRRNRSHPGIKHLLHQPLSLQTWSTLVVSEQLGIKSNLSAENNSNFPAVIPDANRISKVNALPLPESVRNVLKFKTKFSHLCVSQWQYLGPQTNGDDDNVNTNTTAIKENDDVTATQLDDIVLDGVTVRRFTMETCTDTSCDCQGVGQRVKPL